LNLMFECSPLRAALLESSRDHYRGFGAGFDAVSDELRNRRCGGGNYSQVHRSGDVANVPVGFEPQHFFMLGVDGIDGTLKAVQQVLQNGSTYRTGTIGSADDSHRTGSEHCVQAVFRWCSIFCGVQRLLAISLA